MKKKRILFIINPKSGNKSKNYTVKAIQKLINHELFDVHFIYTKYAGHAFELALNKLDEFKIIAAVGGDGTVNEIVSALANSNTLLAIIPSGSGNGLAGHLKISRNIKKAVETINKEFSKSIDTININNKICANVSGVGFDALIGSKFQVSKNRGFINYIRLVLKEFVGYKPAFYELEIDGEKVRKDAFLISFANSGQFGNNAYIAPEAELDDGKIDVVILNKFPFTKGFNLAYKLFNKTLHNSKYINTYKAREIKLINNKDIIAHIDGEPITFKGDVLLKINDKSLKVICPR